MTVSIVELIGGGIFAGAAVGFAFANYPLFVIGSFVLAVACVASAENHATDYSENDVKDDV